MPRRTQSARAHPGSGRVPPVRAASYNGPFYVPADPPRILGYGRTTPLRTARLDPYHWEDADVSYPPSPHAPPQSPTFSQELTPRTRHDWDDYFRSLITRGIDPEGNTIPHDTIVRAHRAHGTLQNLSEEQLIDLHSRAARLLLARHGVPDQPPGDLQWIPSLTRTSTPQRTPSSSTQRRSSLPVSVSRSDAVTFTPSSSGTPRSLARSSASRSVRGSSAVLGRRRRSHSDSSYDLRPSSSTSRSSRSTGSTESTGRSVRRRPNPPGEAGQRRAKRKVACKPRRTPARRRPHKI